jgi:hypothetical protein
MIRRLDSERLENILKAFFMPTRPRNGIWKLLDFFLPKQPPHLPEERQ